MPIYLGDVAEIKINGKAPKLGCASLRGHEAVLLTVTKQPNTSTIELTEKLEEALNDIQKTCHMMLKYLLIYSDKVNS